jgi:hypothetical protein
MSTAPRGAPSVATACTLLNSYTRQATRSMQGDLDMWSAWKREEIQEPRHPTCRPPLPADRWALAPHWSQQWHWYSSVLDPKIKGVHWHPGRGGSIEKSLVTYQRRRARRACGLRLQGWVPDAEHTSTCERQGCGGTVLEQAQGNHHLLPPQPSHKCDPSAPGLCFFPLQCRDLFPVVGDSRHANVHACSV